MSGKGQVEILMNELLGFAEKMLREYGEFLPFGGYLRHSGAVVHVGAKSNPSSKDSREQMDILITSFKKMAFSGDAEAFGIVADVKLPYDDGSNGDAIQFILEHEDGYCAEVFFRYKKGVLGKVEITAPIAQQGEPQFFVTLP